MWLPQAAFALLVLTSLPLTGSPHDPVQLDLAPVGPADLGLPQTFRLTTSPNLQPGAWYRLETAPAVGTNTLWTVLEPLRADSSSLSLELYALETNQTFFRLRLPEPALFRVEPAIAPTTGGNSFFLLGQMLPTGGQVHIGGQTVTPDVIQEGMVYRCVAPPLPAGVYDVEWLDHGQVVARLPRGLTVTASPTPVAQRLTEPPAEPPASPEWAAKKKVVKFKAGAELAGSVNTGKRLLPAGGGPSGEDDAVEAWGGGLQLLPATGELQLQECDVLVPGVGLDFAFVRTYRSRTGRTTPMGHNWDHSYNLAIEAEGDDIAVCDGTGRRDVLFRQADGTFSRDEFFWQGRNNPTNGQFILEFPGKGVWEFHPLTLHPAGGRIARIADANGNQLQFAYDLSGRLVEVTDTLGRAFTFSYNADGILTQLADFTGRVWTYAYHTNGSAGGSGGDLASVTTPAVTNTPTGNDFPLGKTTRYTYTRGHAQPDLNHNLTSITDPKGQTSLQITYHTNTNPADVAFDTVALLERGADKTHLWRGALATHPDTRYAVVRAIVRDGVGNVCETFCDSLNRPVIVRQFTGRSSTASPVTATENRPTGRLRDTDPAYYETAFEWNRDSLLTRYIWPDGDETRCVYEREFDPAANPRKKGDLRVHREHAVAVGDLDGDGQADFTERVWRFEHDPRFGAPIRRLKAEMYCEDIRFSFVPSGRKAKPEAKAKELAELRSRPPAVNRTPGRGYNLFDSFPCQWKRITDPRGNVTTATYDERGNLTQFRTTDPASGVTQLDCDYDARGRLTRCVQPADAQGLRRQDAFTYYTNGPMAGYLATARCDDGGLNLTTTFEYDARGNLTRCVAPRGNDTLWTYNALDQVVQTQTPPAGGGQRIATRFFYDANDNLVQVDHENRDANGALDATNPWWTRFTQFDALNRPVLVAHELAHVVQQGTVYLTNRLGWDANDNLIRLEGPRAVSGEDPHQQTVFTYDERNLPFTAVGAPGTGLDATNRWDYDAKGDPAAHTRSGGGIITNRVARIEVTRFRQPVRISDPAGNVTLCSYDRAGNLVRVRHFGETNDVPGSVGNRRLLETRFAYDALDRRVSWRDSFFDIFSEQPIGDGDSITTFTYASNGQLASETDDLGRTTRYTYDTAGRCVAVTDPATNRVEFTRDANGNVTLVRQVDRSDLGGPEPVFLLTRAYDPCDRLIRETDNVGNASQFAYDSRGNAVRVTGPRNNDTCSTYDGLGRLIRSLVYIGPCDASAVLTSLHLEYQDTRLLRLTDGNSNVTRYAYDSLDRCVAVTNADTTVVQFAYDAFDNLVQRRDANGTLVISTYDLLDRCVRRDITPGPGVANSTTFEQFAYDGLSRLVLATNDASLVEFGYLGVGLGWSAIQARDKARQDGSLARVTRDSVGTIKSLALPSGRVLTAAHDALNRVTALHLVAGGLVTPLATFAYDGPQRLGRIARPNGINTHITWNGALTPPNPPGDFGWQQVLRLSHQFAGGGAVIDQRGHAYDRSQNKTLRAQLAPFSQGTPLQTNRWEADALNRLVQSDTFHGNVWANSRTYQIDANGNRQFVLENGVAQPYVMDPKLPEPADFQMNQYTASPFGEYLYDPNGNRVSMQSAAGEFLLTYDYANRLVRVERLTSGAPATLFTYTYDALGRRLTRTFHPEPPLAPQVTRYVYHPADDTVVEEWRDGALHLTAAGPHTLFAGPSSASHAAAGQILIPAVGPGHYVLCDDLGNALALTDASGNVLERYDYDDFGQPRFLDAAGNPLVDGNGLPVNASPAGLDWLYRGAYWNVALGLHEAVSVGVCDLPADFDPFNATPLTRVNLDANRPNRISMNVSVPGGRRRFDCTLRISTNVSVGRQTQGADFGQRGCLDGFITATTKVRPSQPDVYVWKLAGEPDLGVRMPAARAGGFDSFLCTCSKPKGCRFCGAGGKLLDRGEAGDNVGLLLRSAPRAKCSGGVCHFDDICFTADSGAAVARHIPLWKKVLNYIWDTGWDPYDPSGGSHGNAYAGVDR